MQPRALLPDPKLCPLKPPLNELDTPDGMLPNSVGFISHIHLRKSPERLFGKGEALLKKLGSYHNPVTFKTDLSDFF